mgnify:CR=1 FL=1
MCDDGKNMSIYICMDETDETEEILYVGSTCATLRQRKAGHKSKMNCAPTPFHKLILENDMWEKIEFFIIEDLPQGDMNKEEWTAALRKREKFHQDRLKPKFCCRRGSKCTAAEKKQTMDAWRAKNKDHIRKYARDKYNNDEKYRQNVQRLNKASRDRMKQDPVRYAKHLEHKRNYVPPKPTAEQLTRRREQGRKRYKRDASKPEFREKSQQRASAYHAKMKADPEYQRKRKERAKEYRQRPEVKKRTLAKQRERRRLKAKQNNAENK